MRVISICPSNTELLASLDALDHLIAADDYSDWPAAVNTLPRVGPDLSIRMDEVEALEPDLVLASLSVPGMEKNVDELKRRGIPHLVLDPQSLKDIGQDLRTVAEAIGQDSDAVLTNYEQVIGEIQERGSAAANRPSLYWEWWPKPVFTPGRINWLTEISELVGASNIFADQETANFQTDWDTVRLRNPDYILLAWVGVLAEKVKPKLVRRRPGWDGMKAYDRIHIMEESLYCRPSPRLIEGAIRLGKLLHPDQFGSMEIPDWLVKNGQA